MRKERSPPASFKRSPRPGFPSIPGGFQIPSEGKSKQKKKKKKKRRRARALRIPDGRRIGCQRHPPRRIRAVHSSARSGAPLSLSPTHPPPPNPRPPHPAHPLHLAAAADSPGLAATGGGGELDLLAPRAHPDAVVLGAGEIRPSPPAGLAPSSRRFTGLM
ncbi:hypothetical protein DAI22_08g146800 [Oryza sativa Japonica Group]|nr:hypothetical protein DAI22_08g146800 [Oryza sativa Japonica Group]